VPADGTSAAAKKGDLGTSRGQLLRQCYTTYPHSATSRQTPLKSLFQQYRPNSDIQALGQYQLTTQQT